MKQQQKMSWSIPSDFLYGYTGEDGAVPYPDTGRDLLDAWIAFCMKILQLTSQHPVGHTMDISIAELNSAQVAAAVKQLRGRGFRLCRIGTVLTVTSHQARRSKRIFNEKTKNTGGY